MRLCISEEDDLHTNNMPHDVVPIHDGRNMRWYFVSRFKEGDSCVFVTVAKPLTLPEPHCQIEFLTTSGDSVFVQKPKRIDPQDMVWEELDLLAGKLGFSPIDNYLARVYCFADAARYLTQSKQPFSSIDYSLDTGWDLSHGSRMTFWIHAIPSGSAGLFAVVRTRTTLYIPGIHVISEAWFSGRQREEFDGVFRWLSANEATDADFISAYRALLGFDESAWPVVGTWKIPVEIAQFSFK